MRDETPAATSGGVNGRNRPRGNRLGGDAGGDISSGPTSFVAAEIHLGRRSAGFSDEPTALQHSSCVPVGVNKNLLIFHCVAGRHSK
jgi:hypothetical protein